MIHIKSKSYQTPEVINDNGCELTNVKSIAKAFNDYFSNFGCNLANNNLEKLVYKRLHQYLKKKEILYHKQFGFCTTYSTTYMHY